MFEAEIQFLLITFEQDKPRLIRALRSSMALHYCHENCECATFRIGTVPKFMRRQILEELEHS